VNWEHLRAFLWLRWRLRVNQNKRAGAANVWIQRVILFFGFAAAGVMLLGSFLVGLLAMTKASPTVLMLVWDGMVVLFLFVWMTELLVELQRSELLAMDKFLHLPVSLNGAFLINYVGSIFSPGVVIVFSAMVGFSAGLLISRGITMIGLFPLLFAFIVAVTSIAYQFRGWLASLMVNKRRRRTIATIAGLVFVLIVQLPNILTQPWRSRSRDRNVRSQQRLSMEEVGRIAERINRIVPLGWLPYGAMTSSEGRFSPSLLGALGLGLIGAASLRRSYMTTLRLYRGEFTERASVRQRPASRSLSQVSEGSTSFLERRLPWVTEETSAVALACFRSLVRAPEASILLLSPVFMLFIFGSVFLRGNASPPELVRPLVATGGIGLVLLILGQLAGNQFGFDRNGFRSYVLSPVDRENILIGKNLALAPLAVGLTMLVVGILQVALPMRIDHFLATLTQTVPMYVLFCIVENFLSMLAPMPIAPGSLKPSKPKGIQVLIHVGFMFLFPMALSPVLIPLGIEFLLSRSREVTWVPAYLLFVLIETVAVLALYRVAVKSQGEIFQRRERRILEVVTTKAE